MPSTEQERLRELHDALVAGVEADSELRLWGRKTEYDDVEGIARIGVRVKAKSDISVRHTVAQLEISAPDKNAVITGRGGSAERVEILLEHWTIDLTEGYEVGRPSRTDIAGEDETESYDDAEGAADRILSELMREL